MFDLSKLLASVKNYFYTDNSKNIKENLAILYRYSEMPDIYNCITELDRKILAIIADDITNGEKLTKIKNECRNADSEANLEKFYDYKELFRLYKLKYKDDYLSNEIVDQIIDRFLKKKIEICRVEFNNIIYEDVSPQNFLSSTC